MRYEKRIIKWYGSSQWELNLRSLDCWTDGSVTASNYFYLILLLMRNNLLSNSMIPTINFILLKEQTIERRDTVDYDYIKRVKILFPLSFLVRIVSHCCCGALVDTGRWSSGLTCLRSKFPHSTHHFFLFQRAASKEFFCSQSSTVPTRSSRPSW